MVAALLYWLLAGIVGLVVGVAGGIGDTTSTGGQHLAASGLTRTITRSVHAYLDQHATGLPVPAHTLWLAWLCTTAGLFVLAVAGSRGARVGWVISGAMTAAMVYAGTPEQGRAVASGLAVTVWAVLSVVALNRLFPGGSPILLAVRLPHRPQPDEPDGSTE